MHHHGNALEQMTLDLDTFRTNCICVTDFVSWLDTTLKRGIHALAGVAYTPTGSFCSNNIVMPTADKPAAFTFSIGFDVYKLAGELVESEPLPGLTLTPTILEANGHRFLEGLTATFDIAQFRMLQYLVLTYAMRIWGANAAHSGSWSEPEVLTWIDSLLAKFDTDTRVEKFKLLVDTGLLTTEADLSVMLTTMPKPNDTLPGGDFTLDGRILRS